MSKNPSLWSACLFYGKSRLLQLRRAYRNYFIERLEKHPHGKQYAHSRILAISPSPLYTAATEGERVLNLGKVHNLRLAAAKLDGIEVPAGKVFSFWEQLGRASRRHGYVYGRELREGCIIPAIGGGLCQLSNALYDAALQAGMQIVERHAHTQVIEGSLAEKGRDATVFWNYVDLRFISATAFRLEVNVTKHELHVILRGEARPSMPGASLYTKQGNFTAIGNCLDCGEASCFRHFKANKATEKGKTERTAMLLDTYWPEYDAYFRGMDKQNSQMYLPVSPLVQKIVGKRGYEWNTAGFQDWKSADLIAVKRGLSTRKLPANGQLQAQLIQWDEALALQYARWLKPQDTHLYVSQNLLPFLEKHKVLGGRSYDVLMTRLPMYALQTNLDKAFSAYTSSKTLNDFRASSQLTELEQKALLGADNIITPHTAIAALYGAKAIQLDWQVAPAQLSNLGNRDNIVFFPTSALGRKGAYELREALTGLDVRLMPLGRNIEEEGFWKDINTVPYSPDWTKQVKLAVLPAHVENNPRQLLKAIAAGIPVIASPACGLKGYKGVIEVEAGNVKQLRECILGALEDISRNF